MFRLPIDRVFTIKGFGTIVTGTVLGGEVAIGDELAVIPSGLDRARARHRGPRRGGRARGRRPSRGAQPRRRRGRRSRARRPARASRAGRRLAHPRRRAALPRDGAGAAPAALEGARPPRHRAGAGDARARRRGPARAGRDRARAAADRSRRRRSARCPAITSSCAGSSRRRAHGSTIGGGRDHPRARAEGAQGEQHAATVGDARGRAARSTDRARRASAAARRAVARRARAAARPPRRGARRPLATLVAGGELLVTGTGEHAHYLHAQAVAELEAQDRRARRGASPTACRARSCARSCPRRCRRARTTRSSPGSAARARRERRAIACASRDAARGPRSRRSRPAVLAKLEATGVEPPRPKELAGRCSGSTEPQVEGRARPPDRGEARRSRSSPTS